MKLLRISMDSHTTSGAKLALRLALGVLSIVAMASSGSAQTNRAKVSADQTCHDSTDYAVCIANAIAAVGPGGTVTLGAGLKTVRSRVTISAPVAIQGQGEGVTTLQPDRAIFRQGTPLSTFFLIKAPDVSISNMSLDGSDITQNGILINCGDHLRIANDEIENTFENKEESFGDGVTVADFGNCVGSDPAVGTNDSLFTNLYIHHVGRSCFFVGEGNRDIIDGLTCKSWGFGVVDVEPDATHDAADWSVINGHFDNSSPTRSKAGFAIYLTQGASSTASSVRGWKIENNVIQHATGSGYAGGAITLASPGCLIRGNNISFSEGDALSVNSNDCFVLNNVIWNNGQVGGAYAGGIQVHSSFGFYRGNYIYDDQSKPTQTIAVGEDSTMWDYNIYVQNRVKAGVAGSPDYELPSRHDIWLAPNATFGKSSISHTALYVGGVALPPAASIFHQIAVR